MKRNEPSSKKPLYERAAIWIGMLASIFAILGISVKGVISRNDDVVSVTEPFPKPIPIESPPPESFEDVVSQEDTISPTIPQDDMNSQDQLNTGKTVSETHTPKDLVSVYYPNWDIDKDYGIDGNRYNGGIKVTIKFLFTTLGSSLSKDISSRISIPITDDMKESTPMEERIFAGSIILHESMYGSKSTATVKIIVNNETPFSVELNSDVTEAVNFEVNYGDADSIIVQTDATLRGSDFVFGIVNRKE